MLRLFGVHGPRADPARLAALVEAMDRALDPAVYPARRDLAPDPALLIRLRAAETETVEAGAATGRGVAVAGRLRLYGGEGPRADPAADLAALARRLADDPDALPLRTADFGLAIWEAGPRRLRLATDAFGSQPLHHARLGDVLAFADSPHLLLALPEFPRELDPLAAAAYMASVPQPETRSFFLGVNRLGRAQSLARGPDGEDAFETLWRPGPAAGASGIAEVRDAVRAAVAGRLRHAARPVIEISGGLDSALVAGLATELRPDLGFQAVSNILPDGYAGPARDERAFIEATLAHNPAIRPGYVSSEGADVFAGAEEAWIRLAAPCLDAYAFMTAHGLAATAEADAVIGGFGGDQCLSAPGGPFFYEMLARGRIGAALGEWARLRRVYGTGRLSLLHFALFRRLPVFPLWKALRGPAPTVDALAASAAADPETAAHLRRWGWRRHARGETSIRQLETEGLAQIEDWMTYDHDDPATGRSRANLRPLIDPRVIEAAMAAPSALKVSGDFDRALARAVGGDRLPPEVARRIDKMAFAPDYASLVAARAPEIEAGFARFRRHPLWREFVDAEAAEAALARLAAAPDEAGLDATLGKVIRSHHFGLFLERAFPVDDASQSEIRSD